MTARTSSILTGLVLVAVSALWCWGVIATIPGADDGSRLGARGFPLGTGLLLGFLGAVLVLQGLVSRTGPAAPEDSEGGPPAHIELWAVAATVLLLGGYAFLLEFTGFMIATAVTVAIAIGPVLGVWRAKLIALTSLGMSLGIYLVFGKLLGVYLPYGKLINISF